MINAKTHERSPAFDPVKLATALSKETGKKIDAATLTARRIAFGETPEQLFVQVGGQEWQLNLTSYELKKAQFPRGASDVELFMPPRRSGESRRSTTIRIVNSRTRPLNLYWIDRSGKPVSYGEISPGETHEQHTYVGHVWMVEGKLRSGCFVARENDEHVFDGDALRNTRQAERRSQRPDNSLVKRSSRGNYPVTLQDDDLQIQLNDGEQKRVTFDGTPDRTYANPRSKQANVHWAADRTHFLAIQSTTPAERVVHFVESSPKGRLQPKLQSQNYAKPGDPLGSKSLSVFSVPDLQRIDISDELMPNPWSLTFEGWSADSKHFFLRYNQRGHQVMRLLKVAAADGSVRVVVEEKTDTFIQYSDRGKSIFEDLGRGSFAWASERTGWNHLYRYSFKDGTFQNEITRGNWNVKRIVDFDRGAGVIWFYAVGVYPDQDPYHEHFCRVNFDGSGFKILTDGDGTHKVKFENDRKYFVDTYSRVDMAPVTELRDSTTGKLIAELRRDDTQARFGARRLTERFVAKGRDGKTDIWGIIHWPINFDPDETYPVVENIYAGPHDHHVPKSFRSRYWHQHPIADAGMIVVQIDGMGTAWRSKEFHDVCYKNLRDAGFPDRIAWIKAAAKEYPQMDLSRVGIYGGSAGGQNAMAALLWHNDFYKVAVADCGCHDNRMDKIWWNEQWMGWPVDDSYRQNSNMENAHLLKGDLMLLVGELDRNVDPASTTQVVSKLIKADKDFEFVLVAGAGHGSAETPWGSKKRLNFLSEKLKAE